MKTILLPNNKVYKIKNDSFKQSRGRSQMLNISCSKCATQTLIYQKDGPGPLLRCYLDRIAWPENLPALSPVICKNCNTVIGIPMVYEKENRLAFRMISENFNKKNYKQK